MPIEVKRLDQQHPEAPGNKYFKLKYNLIKAQEKSVDRIVTVGGPFSNHLHATASACQKAGIPCVGLVHGSRPPKLSPTLSDCEAWGMELVFIEREWFALRNSESFKQWVHEEYRFCHFIPEGGSNFLGINGCMEILDDEDKEADIIAVSVGTGTTLAGILLSAKPGQRILAFPALKDESLPTRLQQQLLWALFDEELAQELSKRVEWIWDYTFGGFAKCPPELQSFMHQKEQASLPLDRVYTAKMMFGLEDLLKQGKLASAESILAIHTGGLQGNRPVEE
ncbi:1-aminocyclopropane-1-carboxylate deaminase/D-cysteine desulfhydrase [Sanyastnella coralliicola]|uniref:1-aminocyclopropane-1-carboxylate deaminase/D-cysteine desulfhydrase n=1 Tax=Sanyastnella coralliicola TaxID=3069118 RepID=UPI0027BAA65C|nr:pyridoxal-phosphate dependent enzyme [Longitalea sp. SCSIO 12813]